MYSALDVSCQPASKEYQKVTDTNKRMPASRRNLFEDEGGDASGRQKTMPTVIDSRKIMIREEEILFRQVCRGGGLRSLD
jgi:hypothetical protein